MTKLLHTRSKIFFPNPYVVMVEYTDSPTGDVSMYEKHYRNLCKKTYTLMDGTWGCTPLVTDVNVAEDNISIGFTVRGYFVFKNEIDVLQFRLSCDMTNRRVFIWPSKLDFTIHEFVEDPALQQTI
jgi:hypothetical protein